MSDYSEMHERISELERKLEVAREDVRILETKIIKAEDVRDIAIEALKKMANADFRGNRSSESVEAFNVLKKLGER